MIPQVLVNWTYELSDQTGFLLQRCNNLSGVWNVDIATGGDTFEYTDSDVAVGDTRSYQVAATNEYGTGSFSNTGGYIVVPPNTDIPYEIGQSLTIVDVASGSNGFLTTFYYHDAGQQVAFTSSNGNNWTTASIIPAELIVGGVAWAYGNGRYLTIGTVAR